MAASPLAGGHRVLPGKVSVEKLRKVSQIVFVLVCGWFLAFHVVNGKAIDLEEGSKLCFFAWREGD